MTTLTAHLETSFSTHVNPVRRETVEVDGFVSALTAVSLRHLQVEQGVIWVQRSIVQRLFSPRESSAQTLQSFTPAQTNSSPTCLLYANLSQYTIKLSLKTFNTNDDGQEMIVINSHKSTLPTWHLVSLFSGYSVQLNSEMIMFCCVMPLSPFHEWTLKPWEQETRQSCTLSECPYHKCINFNISWWNIQLPLHSTWYKTLLIW